MSDQTPPQDPYGQPPANPYGQNPPPGQDPAAPPNPYGQPPANPYAQPGANPYGQAAPPPYGQNPYPAQTSGQPYPAQPYPGSQGGPLGDGLDMYGRPLVNNDPRPGTVTAAGWITLVVSGLTALLFGGFAIAVAVSKDDMVREIEKALREQGTAPDVDANAIYSAAMIVCVLLALWCLIACLLAVFAMRRSNIARILLVISAVIVALLSLLGITSGVSAIWLVACLAVVVLLFTGGAGDWYARRSR